MFHFVEKDTEFFDLFVDSAKYFYQGAQMLDEVMMDYSKASDKVKAIIDLEHEADELNEKIVDKLNISFITPLDREDIYALAAGLGMGVDILQGTLQRIVMYKTGEAIAGAIGLTKLINEATHELMTAFTLLKDIKKNQKELLEAVHKIVDLESEGDRIYRHEVAQLFDDIKDPIELIKWKDILENLEETLDHSEKLAGQIRGMVMKYA